MTGTAKTGALLTSLTGASGATAGGVYYFSKETIGNLIKDDVLGEGEDFKESWKSQHKKLLDSKESLSTKLAEIKKKYSDNAQTTGHQALANWCKDTYSQTYKHAFSSENKSLLEEAKKYCIQPIKDKFTDDKRPSLSGNTDKSTFESNYKKLKDHNEQKGKLDSRLIALKGSFKEQPTDTEWQAIQSWCSEYFEKPFKGSNDNTFKLVEIFCKKG
ncbi:hypothetical protein HF1_01670 [Mycoplasma haemofelis str. Langford 1]|uniref:Uncharacterized protein n=2 Tax=Mycoplasma haemofelis TaxID=29501 RepID=F6FG21_MYCHI|nr:hypothetical protein [Mycoplasma haemofelis]AEG72487.1 hypothetical protein MHF_0188 [Mycoplasma haemofelis Ohio2]CBY92175.1 hypothetical protein HF1_01670 [Mycoplasma haemofelis str. Langford 1]